MRILIVAATELEIAPVVAAFGDARTIGARVTSYTHAGHDVDVLVTGVGMVATAVWCSRALAQTRYDLALNLGVCGSFDRALELGTVVHVVSDRIAELGAEDGDAFLPIEELHLPAEFRFVNASPPANTTIAGLPAVSGITVNTVHGSARSIAAAVRCFNPQVETMEGAAFMSACSVHAAPYAQVRAVSNVVETRNRDAWKMPLAIGRLGETALRILDRP